MDLNLITVCVGPSPRPSLHYLAGHFHVTSYTGAILLNLNKEITVILGTKISLGDWNSIFVELLLFCLSNQFTAFHMLQGTSSARFFPSLPHLGCVSLASVYKWFYYNFHANVYFFASSNQFYRLSHEQQTFISPATMEVWH